MPVLTIVVNIFWYEFNVIKQHFCLAVVQNLFQAQVVITIGIHISGIFEMMNSVGYDGFRLYYPSGDDKPIIRPSIIASHSFLRNGLLYNTDSISKTYTSLSRLGILSYTNIRFEPLPGTNDRLKANVYLVSQPKHSFSFEVEGTNTAGDLGAAASLSFTNRNLFRGSEQLTFKLRGAYESKLLIWG